MELTNSDKVTVAIRRQRLSPIRSMYLANIGTIRSMATTHTFAEACKALQLKTGVDSKAPTLKKFCKEHEISFFSSDKKSRGGKIGGVNRWKKATPENSSKTILGLAPSSC